MGLLSKLSSFATKHGDLLNKGADMLGNAAKSAQESNANRDRLIPSMSATKLARDKFALEAPTARLNQSMKAALMANMAPSHTTWAGPGSGLRGEVPTMTGGMDSAIPMARDAVKPLTDEVLRRNLQDQMAGKDSQDPYMAQFGKSSVGDKMLGWASSGLGILNAFQKPKPPIVMS